MCGDGHVERLDGQRRHAARRQGARLPLYPHQTHPQGGGDEQQVGTTGKPAAAAAAAF